MYNLIQNTLLKQNNVAYTENGARAYATTGSNLLDLNFGIPAMRRSIDWKKVNLAYYEDPKLFTKWLFYLRDAREGIGERQTFRNLFMGLITLNPDVAMGLLGFIPEMGRWDDLTTIMASTTNAGIKTTAMSLIKTQLMQDMDAEHPSLLAKWLPSINAGTAAKHQALEIIKSMNITKAQYRKMLANLRKKIDIVETHICQKDFGKIDYEHVPSQANLKYNGVFLKWDEARRREYLGALSRGEAKIHSAVAFPHDIYHQVSTYNDTCNAALEGMWNALPNLVDPESKTIVVRDGSGSMCCSISEYSNVSALDVASALSIYFAERLTGDLKNKFITFSSRPEIVDMTHCLTLADKKRFLNQFNDCSNTNIQKVFDLLLLTAINNRMSQEDLPANILIISDMEFDSCTYGQRISKTLFENIEKRWNDAGYKMPKLIFWNVNSRTGAIPVIENELGVTLMSGFSVNLVKMAMGNQLDPMDQLKEILNGERYSFVDEVFGAVEDQNRIH